MSSRLRPRRGRVYGARASRQKGRSLPGPELGAAPIAAAAPRVPLAPFPLASASNDAPAVTAPLSVHNDNAQLRLAASPQTIRAYFPPTRPAPLKGQVAGLRGRAGGPVPWLGAARRAPLAATSGNARCPPFAVPPGTLAMASHPSTTSGTAPLPLRTPPI